jgi:hypothetical protein
VRDLYILDASVLIDLTATEPSVLALISTRVGTLHIASTMLREEVPELTVDECTSLSIQVVDPSLAILTAAATKITGLSFHDRVCMLLAQQQRWTCLTNDARLRRECKARAIAFQWGLEPVVELVTNGHLERAKAKALIAALHARSPGHYKATVVQRFLKAIGS